MNIELNKKELDIIADSLAFRAEELKKDISKQKNLNSKKYRDKVSEINKAEKLLDDLYKIDKNISHGVLLGLYK